MHSPAVRVVLSASLASCRPGTIIPQDLKCEWMTDPRVVDVAEPRLSWINEVEKNLRNEVQTAYRILVASSEDLLEEGNVDMWDSGKVCSDQSILVKCFLLTISVSLRQHMPRLHAGGGREQMSSRKNFAGSFRCLQTIISEESRSRL